MQLHVSSYYLFPPPNILHNTYFSDTATFFSSLRVRDQVSLRYETTWESIDVYILIILCIEKGQYRKFWTEW